MKLTVIAALCLFLLFNIHFSMAKKRIGLNPFKKTPKTKTNVDTKSKGKQEFNQGGYPQQPDRPGGNPHQGGYPQQPDRPGGNPHQGGYPQQPGGYPQQPDRPGGNPHQGGHPQQPDRPGGNPHQGGYPQQPDRPGGYPYQGSYPQQPHRPGGNPYQGGYPQQPGNPAGSYPAAGYPAQGYPYGRGYGGYGGHGGYPGGYMNQNPNNKILSPQYGGSFGYGGHGVGGGSPFSHSVQGMGVYPQDRSRGFGRSAVMAAAGGAMAGMALGYGLGRFPRPHFPFHSPQEEYYYNHYMYRRYGVRSTDADDYGRDYRYSQPPQTYDSFMDSCMKRTDLLPVENRKPKLNPAATTTITVTSTATTTAAAPHTGIGSNTTESNSSRAENTSTSSPSTQRPLDESEAKSVPPVPQALRKAASDEDDDEDTVSIVEIGYPALIGQMKARRCVELYMVYSEKYLKKTTEPGVDGGVQGLEMCLQGFLALVTSTIVMLLNSNVLTMLHH